MNASWKTWLGSGLTASALALGCNSTSKQSGGCATCGGVQTPAAVAPASPYGPIATTKVPEVSHEMAAPPVQRPISERVTATTPVRSGVASPTEADLGLGVTGYHHNPEYTILVGELIQNRRQNTWRLRFAGLDEEDRYGGSVTLHNLGREMASFKHGQHVRVEGAVIDPESKEVSPAFRVREILPTGTGH